MHSMPVEYCIFFKCINRQKTNFIMMCCSYVKLSDSDTGLNYAPQLSQYHARKFSFKCIWDTVLF